MHGVALMDCFHPGGTRADSINTVTVSTVGGLLGLLLLVVVVAVIIGTCTGLCVRRRRRSKAISKGMRGLKPNHVVLVELLLHTFIVKSINIVHQGLYCFYQNLLICRV